MWIVDEIPFPLLDKCGYFENSLPLVHPHGLRIPLFGIKVFGILFHCICLRSDLLTQRLWLALMGDNLDMGHPFHKINCLAHFPSLFIIKS